MAEPPQKRASVFLNIPYDRDFRELYLAYICGISAFGLAPRASLEIPGGGRRLDRIFALIQECPYSVHDLSRVELSRTLPQTPRFNMPFELGLAVAWERMREHKHVWFAFETHKHRLSKSLSDLDGTDVYAHGGKAGGVFRELGNALLREGRQPTVQQMRAIHREVKANLPAIVRAAGTKSVFAARAFKEICVLASAAAEKIVRAK